MKSFEQICSMSQKELKAYLKKYLNGKHYKVIDEDGFLFAKAKDKNPIPVLLTAHMDTVHTKNITTIEKVPYVTKDGKTETRISSPQGIGGDDRCGVYMIMNIIKYYNVSVLFCEDEEIGRVGAKKFVKTKHVDDIDIKYMIELDRHGSNDAVYYDCDNKEFTKWIEENTGYKKTWGSFSDISTLMPALKIAGVNFSCGYYNEHKTEEYVVLEEMEATQNMVCELLNKEIPQTFEFIEDVWSSYYNNSYSKSYSSFGSSSYRNSNQNSQLSLKDYCYDDFDYDYDYDGYGDDYFSKLQKKSKTNTSNNATNSKNKKKKPIIQISDTEVELFVMVDPDEFGYSTLSITASTKPECWMRLFMKYKYLTYNDIEDYYYV